jgi:outer membrane protein OmpA-like peptidoglycan-associated protein
VLRGTLGALGGPLKLDVNGELREFAVERANPYVLEHAGWKTTEGRLTSTIQCRIDGDALSAKTRSRISRLQLVRATAQDNAQARLGLPLGMLTSLMKDKRGDINVSFPVGGRLSDPRFDFSEAIWSAVRAVAINAVALPVSWIGRMHVSADSKIQRIEVDPLPFEADTAELTPEGQARVARVAAFLDRLPEVKMALTPVISANDVKDLKQDAVVPAAAVTPEPVPSSSKLAERRVDVVRSTLKQAGIDTARLEVKKPVQQNDVEGHVALNVLEPEAPRASKVRDTIGRVRDRLKGSDAKE